MGKKFFVHRTDEHGDGYFGILGGDEVVNFTYDSDTDMYLAVKMLIEIGAIERDDVLLLDADEIYSHLKAED